MLVIVLIMLIAIPIFLSGFFHEPTYVKTIGSTFLYPPSRDQCLQFVCDGQCAASSGRQICYMNKDDPNFPPECKIYDFWSTPCRNVSQAYGTARENSNHSQDISLDVNARFDEPVAEIIQNQERNAERGTFLP